MANNYVNNVDLSNEILKYKAEMDQYDAEIEFLKSQGITKFPKKPRSK